MSSKERVEIREVSEADIPAHILAQYKANEVEVERENRLEAKRAEEERLAQLERERIEKEKFDAGITQYEQALGLLKTVHNLKTLGRNDFKNKLYEAFCYLAQSIERGYAPAESHTNKLVNSAFSSDNIGDYELCILSYSMTLPSAKIQDKIVNYFKNYFNNCFVNSNIDELEFTYLDFIYRDNKSELIVIADEYLDVRLNRIENGQIVRGKDFQWLSTSSYHNLKKVNKFITKHISADQNNQFVAAGIYMFGNKMVGKNIYSAVLFLNSAIDNGNVAAENFLKCLVDESMQNEAFNYHLFISIVLFTGNKCMNRNDLYALEWFYAAAEYDPDTAVYFNIINANNENMFLRGLLYRTGFETKMLAVEKDEKVANNLAQRAFYQYEIDAANANYEAQCSLAYCYFNGFGCERSFKSARNIYAEILKVMPQNVDVLVKYKEAKEALSKQRKKRFLIFVFVLAVVAIIGLAGFYQEGLLNLFDNM